MLWNQHRVLGLAPQGAVGLPVVVACSRAGGLGVLDFERSMPTIEVIREVERFGLRSFAIRTDLNQVSAGWIADAYPGLEVVIGTKSQSEGHIATAVKRVHSCGRRLVCEVISVDEAVAATGAGADGLVVAGNEAGGWVGGDSSLILLQAVLARTDRPVWVRGGIGPRAAAGCKAAGAAGVVLDGALLLARESPMADEIRRLIESWDGSETSLIEPEAGPLIRVFAPRMSPVLDRLKEAAKQGGESWDRAVEEHVGWKRGQAWPVGQDAALASRLADCHVSTGGIVQAVERAMMAGLEGAARARPLAEQAPLARAHGSLYPILQGPMTRVSDVAAFAVAVARGGATPFVALALQAGPAVEILLRETARHVGELPWGVGLLGFAPEELRREQLAAVYAVRPAFAIIAGGRPDQALELEREGIRTYLHVPSPGLLDQFLRAGSRRFVLEGRECGGHVGPRSSFILWEQACDVLERAMDSGIPPETVSVVLAGGIHDARSAATVAAMTGDLAVRGLNIGILMGTAYLFTREAVATGAILPRFQDEALRCRATVLLETSPGHLVRVSPTPFADRFSAERQRLLAAGGTPEEVRQTLERLNAGRLRIAAKGVDRGQDDDAPLVAVAEAEQVANGLYMLGQVATLRERIVSLGELHQAVTSGATRWIEDRLSHPVSIVSPEPKPEPAAVAIVGMACVFPGAGDVESFWANSLRGIDSITEVPPDRWDWRLYYDPDPKAPDKISSKWGGFLPDVPFDPLRYGMPPTSLPSIEPAQLLALEVARKALADAGYARRPFPRERTAVVLGMGGGAAQVAMGYAFRSYLPLLDAVTPGVGTSSLESCKGLLPEWTEDSFPGFLLNVTAGRIANRLDLGGANYAVDAACGSSLAALNLAVRELTTGSAEMVVLGGVDTVQNPFTYLAFSKTQAFSPRGRCRPFDAGADGIVISEGVAMVILKRLADAERDGDRIYAVIQGVGASSDGRCRGLTAPSFEGQVRALERAYSRAGIDPATVGYVEAHGTGTAVGDVVEIEALTRLFVGRGARPRSCVVGSVKSQIGHTKCAAGLAGLIHVSLALHHRVLPPTIGIDTPNPKLDLRDGPFRLNVEARPWLNRPNSEHARRAGVSAFGFGGTNFHAVIESYEGDPLARRGPVVRDWPAELLVWTTSEVSDLLKELDHLASRFATGSTFLLRDLAHGLAVRFGEGPRSGGPTLAIVATSHEDLASKLDLTRVALRGGQTELTDPRGIYYQAHAPFNGQSVAFLFPGQGSQSVGMLGELATQFEEVRGAFELFDAVLMSRGASEIGPMVFPSPGFDEDTRRYQAEELQATEVAQPAIGAASLGMTRLLRNLGLEPDMVAGHSYGELVALHAAGMLDEFGLAELSEIRGRLLREAAGAHPGAMAALSAGCEVVESLIGGRHEVRVVNLNGPQQTVIAGPRDCVAELVDQARAEDIGGRVLPVACAFHTPIMQPACKPLVEEAARRLTAAPNRPVFSNLDAVIHPGDREEVARRLGDHLTHAVRFAEMIDAMYVAGARVFIEAGPGSVLTTLVGSILRDRPHLAVATDRSGKPGLPSLLNALARIIVAGVRMNLQPLTRGRYRAELDPSALPADGASPPLAASAWMVNGSRARPVGAPEPRRLGQALPPSGSVVGNAHGRHAHENAVRTIMSEPSSKNGSAHPTNGRLAHVKSTIPSASDRQGVAPERVLASFQETMRTFLEVQRTTMLAYLSGRQSATETSHQELAHGEDANDRRKSIVHPPVRRAPANGSGTLAADVSSAIAPPHLAPAARVPRSAIEAKLLQIVRDRTGYPPEVLRMELDLEADLGIDSIKRVEILGKLRDAFPQLAETTSQSIEALTRAMTLGAIVDRVEKLLGRPVDSSSDRTAIATLTNEKPRGTVRRSVIQPVGAPLGDRRRGFMPGGTVLLTADDRGVSSALISRLRANDITVLEFGGCDSGLDWTSPSAIDQAVGSLREDGPLAGLIHLRNLARGGLPESDRALCTGRMSSDIRGLFLLARAMADDLERAALLGGSCLVAATAMGGAYAGTAATSTDSFPGGGGVAGLVKTLAREWLAVRVRVVDVDPFEEPSQLAEYLDAEAFYDDLWPEVGYLQGRRIRLQPTAAALVDAGTFIKPAPGEPILISGGARGITALVAAEMARRWQPTLLLLGTTPLPLEDEEESVRGITEASELKSALYRRLSDSGRSISASVLEEAYRDLLRAREVRSNLEMIRSFGSRVEYARADVRVASRLESVLGEWRREFGEPIGLIHGAGLIRDKLIRDKSAESFDLVMGTKLDGALNLARMLRPDLLRFTALFSSIAGRFGNPGQSDYAAANEAMTKFALWLDRQWPGRVVAPIWGPWAGVGMVSDLEDHLGARGLGMITPEAGIAAFMDELTRGRKGDVEVMLADTLGDLDQPLERARLRVESVR